MTTHGNIKGPLEVELEAARKIYLLGRKLKNLRRLNRQLLARNAELIAELEEARR